MRTLIKITILLLMIGAMNAGLVYAKAKTLTYHTFKDEHSDEVLIETIITINERNDGKTTINRQRPFKDCTVNDEYLLDTNNTVLSWTRTCAGEGTDFTAENTGETFIIEGTVKGKSAAREINIGRKELHVYPKYGLSKFAFSNILKMNFWTLRRDKLAKLPMRAVNKGSGTIDLNGKEVNAHKVYYSVTGKLREKFYNHNIYYRTSDGVYIKKIDQDGEVEILVDEK